jgi:hypothetical protein
MRLWFDDLSKRWEASVRIAPLAWRAVKGTIGSRTRWKELAYAIARPQRPKARRLKLSSERLWSIPSTWST